MGGGTAPFQTSQKKEPAGAPFVAGSANNGLSVDTVTGKIVLGNDVGEPASPAQLLSSREVVDGGAFSVILSDSALPNVQAAVNSSSVNIQDIATASFIDARSIGGGLMRLLAMTNGSVAIIAAQDQTGAQAGVNTGGGTPVVFCVNAVQSWGMTAVLNLFHIKNAGGLGNGIEIDPVANDVKSTGTLTSAQPSVNGAGAWKLGKFVAGAVVPDGANYVEVEIDGVVRKLIVAV